MERRFGIVHEDFRLNGFRFWDEFDTLNDLPKFFDKYLDFSDSELTIFLQQWIENSSIEIKTSGTSAKPKTFEVKRQYILNSVKMTAEYFKLDNTKSALHCLPMVYIAGKMQLVRGLILGLDLHMIKPAICPLKKDQYFDFAALTPQQVSGSIDYLENIKTLLVGGGVFSHKLQRLIKKLNVNVYESFAMAETLSHIAVRKLEDPPGVFTCLPNITISIDYRSCLVIQAKHLGVKRLITNDKVELIQKNRFKFLGRFDFLINSGGIKLIPEVLEQKFSEHINTNYFVSSLPDDVLGQKVILVLEEKRNLFPEHIARKIKEDSKTKKYQIPKEIHVVKKFMRTESGKIIPSKTMRIKPAEILYL